MILWRLTRRPYADLKGQGGELADGRWHTRGRPVVYCTSNAALAVLEVRVHLDLPLDLLPEDYVLMKIERPDDLRVRAIEISDLPKGWRDRDNLCRPIGDAWLRTHSTALLSVPSAIVDVERNALINPKHPDAGRVVVAEILPSAFSSKEWAYRQFRRCSASTTLSKRMSPEHGPPIAIELALSRIGIAVRMLEKDLAYLHARDQRDGMDPTFPISRVRQPQKPGWIPAAVSIMSPRRPPLGFTRDKSC